MKTELRDTLIKQIEDNDKYIHNFQHRILNCYDCLPNTIKYSTETVLKLWHYNSLAKKVILTIDQNRDMAEYKKMLEGLTTSNMPITNDPIQLLDKQMYFLALKEIIKIL